MPLIIVEGQIETNELYDVVEISYKQPNELIDSDIFGHCSLQLLQRYHNKTKQMSTEELQDFLVAPKAPNFMTPQKTTFCIFRTFYTHRLSPRLYILKQEMHSTISKFK